MRQWQQAVTTIAFAGVAATVLAFAPGTAEAQGHGHGHGHGHEGRVPPGQMPPAGECRVWYDDRPPGHQPAPTDCARAERVAYETGGRVIYGDDARRDDRYEHGDRDDDDHEHERRRCDDDDRDCGAYPAPTRYPIPYPTRNPTPYPTRYPSRLPEISWAVAFGRGQLVDGVRQWLGSAASRVDIKDYNRMLRPTVVSWYDGSGQLRQRWYDKNKDGHADRVDIYDNGRVVQSLK